MKFILKSLVAGAIVSTTLALQACAQAISPQWVIDRYGPTEAHWIKPVEHIDHILILGEIADPATTNGQIIVRDNFKGLTLFRYTNLSRIDVYRTPIVPPRQIWNFGPKLGEPEGIYSFELRPRGSPECAPYEQAMSAAEIQLSSPQHPYLSPARESDCITYRYLGPLHGISDEYILVSYLSEEARKMNYAVNVYELRRGDKEILARKVLCGHFRNGPAAPICNENGSILSLINNPELLTGK